MGVRRGPRRDWASLAGLALVVALAVVFAVVLGVGLGVAVAIRPRIPSAEPRTVQRGLGLSTLIPRSRAIGAENRLFVALAGQQHDVAGAGTLDRRLDGFAAVGDHEQVVAAPLAGRLRSTRDLVEDRLTVLAARVLVGDHHDPRALPGDPAHQRSLGRVAFPGRTEDGD